MRQSLLRAGNALRRIRSGLPASGETVSPEVPNDLFQAHRSLYLFCARFAAGRRVLDLGCGTGYGAPELLRGGAEAVVGIDRDPRTVRYAARRFGNDAGGRAELRIDFRVGDPGTALPDGPLGLALALGLLPRLADPTRVLDAVRDRLGPEGLLIAALPPILDGQTLAMHQARPGEPSAMYLWDWESELGLRFRSLRLFRHLPPAGRPLDLANPGPSSLDPAAFRFEEIPRSEIYDVGSLTALFVCGP